MENTELFALIESLPDAQREQIANFVAFLKYKHGKNKTPKERDLGGLKGAFVMSPDFDEPLEDFKDYM